MNKERRRKRAMEKARAKKIAIVIVCALIASVIIGIVLMDVLDTPDRGEGRVFENGGHTITLFENGEFEARLERNVRIRGTYEQSEIGFGAMLVIFDHDGERNAATITERYLLPPEAWGFDIEDVTEFILREAH